MPKRWGALFLTIGITVLLILPTSLLGFFAIKTGLSELSHWKNSPDSDSSFLDAMINQPHIHNLMVALSDKIPVTMNELSGAFQDLSRSIGARLTELLGGVLSHLPGLLMILLVMVVSIYFFMIDGKKLIFFLRKNSIFSPRQTDLLIKSVGGMCKSVILASLVSGLCQAGLETLACAFVGAPNIALIGVIVFVGSFLPVVGSLPITVFLAAQQWMTSGQTAGVVLTIMAIVLIAVDGAIRPWFLKGSANLHPLLAFVAALGGLQSIGFFGMFLGPIVTALFIATLQVVTSESIELVE